MRNDYQVNVNLSALDSGATVYSASGVTWSVNAPKVVDLVTSSSGCLVKGKGITGEGIVRLTALGINGNGDRINGYVDITLTPPVAPSGAATRLVLTAGSGTPIP